MIDHINIVVTDLERAAHFYEAIFGLQRGFRAELNGEWIETVTGLPGARGECLFFEAPAGGARLELIRYDAPGVEQSPLQTLPHERGLRHLAFEVEDIDATLSKVRALGIAPISEPVEVPFRVADLGIKRLAYFHDFDGALVEIAAYQSSS